jgi:SAM-dependent methyltransferase
MQPYDQNFYSKESDACRRSARVIVPLVLDLLAPRRVVDVGCGVGTWLAVFGEHGVSDLLGIDGDYVDRSMLEIPQARFQAADLNRPIPPRDRFDLVVSLEVAEHLPPGSADQFVDTLAELGPAVLFSAAIPFQGGVHHVNEQWPEYWAERFERRGFVTIDCVRPKVWQDPDVLWYYAQNTLLYVRSEFMESRPRLRHAREITARSQLALVHPRKHLESVESMRRLSLTAADLAATLSPGEKFILADNEEFRSLLTAGYRALPFLEHQGQYWGPPQDDATATRELERLRAGGAGHLVIAWPAFWWLSYYREFANHVTRHFRRVLENDRLVIFDLRTAEVAREKA